MDLSPEGLGLLLTLLAGCSSGVLSLRLRPSSPPAGPARLRVLGGLGSMGVALLGAVLLVRRDELPSGLPLGAGLALLGVLGALLASWGGDLLWKRGSSVSRALLGSSVPLLLALFLRLPSWSPVLIVLTALLGTAAGLLLGDPRARARLRALRSQVRPWQALLAVAVLIRVPVPLAPELFPLIGTTQTVLISLAALEWGFSRIGGRIFGLALAAFLLGLAVEYLGSRTGLPFGVYSYATAPAPTVLGVPLLVPLGWFSLVLSAHVLARGNALLTGLGVVAWDLGLEALMPQQRFWIWSDPAPLWYGAPLQNYLAWFVVGAGISALYRRWGAELSTGSSGAAFGWAYRLEALFIPAGLALFGLWPAALLCGVCMNLFAWRQDFALVHRVSAGRLEE